MRRSVRRSLIGCLALLGVLAGCEPTPNPISYLTVTVEPVGAGTVTLDPSGGTYARNTVVRLIAAPEAGFAFSGWSGDLAGTDDPTAIMVDCDKAVTAHFVASGPLTLSTSVEPPEGGSIFVSPTGGSYDPGTFVMLRAEPADGYAFSGWSGDLSGVVYLVYETLYSDMSVTANFTQATSGQFAVHVTMEPAGGGTVTLDPPGGAYDSGTSVTLTAAPGPGYIFSEWHDRHEGVSWTDNPHVLTVDETELISTYFRPANMQFPTGWEPAQGGTVALDPPGGAYPPGTVVTVTATPNDGWVFRDWGWDQTGMPVYQGYPGEIFGTENPVQVTMDTDHFAYANFIPDDRFSFNLTVTPPEGGTVMVDPRAVDSTYAWGTVLTLLPDAADGYVFSGWDGDVTGMQVPGRARMDADKTVTTNFSPVGAGQYTLTLLMDRQDCHDGLGANVTADPPGCVYDPGTEVTLTAQLNGYLSSWEGVDEVDTLSWQPTWAKVIMDSDRVVTLHLGWMYPICQAHKLLDEDAVVRTMAEELLLMMGEREFGYMEWAAREADPPLAGRIHEVMDTIEAGAAPDSLRWPGAAECTTRLYHADSVICIMAAQILRAKQVRKGTELDPALQDRVECLLGEAKAMSLDGPWRR